MIRFCVLEQGQGVGEAATLARRELFTRSFCDHYRLNWKRDDDPHAFITAHDICWSEGRSLLYEHVPKQYDYYIFIDDDLTFHDEARSGDIAAAIQAFLAAYRPLTGTFYDPGSWAFGDESAEARWAGEAHPISCYDLELQLFERSYADVMFPVPFHGSDGSMHYSHWVCHRTHPGKQLCFYGVTVRNHRHDPHEDGIADRRAHATRLVEQFNRHTVDGSFDYGGAWSKAEMVRRNRALREAEVDRKAHSFTLDDLARVYDAGNVEFRARRATRAMTPRVRIRARV